MAIRIGLARFTDRVAALYLDGDLISAGTILEPSDWLRLLRQIPQVRLDSASVQDASITNPPSTWAEVEAAQRTEADRTQEIQKLRTQLSEKQAQLDRLERRLDARQEARPEPREPQAPREPREPREPRAARPSR